MNKIEAAMSYFSDNDRAKNPKRINDNQINQEFKNILLAHYQENLQVKLDQHKARTLFEEIDRLSTLVETKRPDLGDIDKLTMLDEMFHVKFSGNDATSA